MTYSPKPKNIKPLLITISLTILSVLCFMFSGKFPEIKWLLQLLFLCLATTSIQIFLKYVLTKFRYVCDDDYLFIYKSLGKREILIGKLELRNSASYMEVEKEFFKNGDNYNVKSSYSYTRNFQTKDIYILVTMLGETNYMIKIEANDEFATYVNSKIDKILKGLKGHDEF